MGINSIIHLAEDRPRAQVVLTKAHTFVYILNLGYLLSPLKCPSRYASVVSFVRQTGSLRPVPMT
jgi:hypothetical protein